MRFSHENEKAAPDCYQVKFDNGVSTALSATSRGAVLRLHILRKKGSILWWMLINMVEVWYGTKKRTASMVSLIIIMVECLKILLITLLSNLINPLSSPAPMKILVRTLSFNWRLAKNDCPYSFLFY